MVLIQVRTDILSVLTLVQTVCKGYQLMTKDTVSKERVKLIGKEQFANRQRLTFTTCLHTEKDGQITLRKYCIFAGNNFRN